MRKGEKKTYISPDDVSFRPRRLRLIALVERDGRKSRRVVDGVAGGDDGRARGAGNCGRGRSRGVGRVRESQRSRDGHRQESSESDAHRI